ncbi:hypothetical protein WMY93_016817 [Mugilogobius chulae]|uniref:C-type lectin domain-containing protein n=1 Tax=Mugilogobius chulae TaxID=88201 RepID=A0AAW0NWL8_9GOBI
MSSWVRIPLLDRRLELKLFIMKLLVVFVLVCAAAAFGKANNQFEDDPEAQTDPENLADADVDQVNDKAEGDSVAKEDGIYDWIRWRSFGGRRYLFVPDSVHWAAAKHFCRRAFGATLVTVQNTQVDQFLKGLADGRASWIGLSRPYPAGSWSWVNGESVSYTGWCKGEPNNYHGRFQNCALTNWTGRKCWDDQNSLGKAAPEIEPRRSAPRPSQFVKRLSKRVGTGWSGKKTLKLFIMKLLVVFVLVCAAAALGKADPEAQPDPESLTGADVEQVNDKGPESADEFELSEDDAEPEEDEAELSEAEVDAAAKVENGLKPYRWYSIGGHKYVYVPRSYHWVQAEGYCRRWGAHLATVQNSHVNTF